MFVWLNKQGVKSESGFILQRMTRYSYHYTEGNYILKINVEPGVKHEELSFGARVSWGKPFQHDLISDSDVGMIRQRVREALKFMGIRFKFVD
jgi:hypothetical protein